jgi:hypothetical protein
VSFWPQFGRLWEKPLHYRYSSRPNGTGSKICRVSWATSMCMLEMNTMLRQIGKCSPAILTGNSDPVPSDYLALSKN